MQGLPWLGGRVPSSLAMLCLPLPSGGGACHPAGLTVSPLMFQELLQKEEEEAAAKAAKSGKNTRRRRTKTTKESASSEKNEKSSK